MSLNELICTQTTLNEPNWAQQSLNMCKWPWMSSKVSKWTQMSLNKPKGAWISELYVQNDPISMSSKCLLNER